MGSLIGFVLLAVVVGLGISAANAWEVWRARRQAARQAAQQAAAAAARGGQVSYRGWVAPEIYAAINPLLEFFNLASWPAELEGHPALASTVDLLLEQEYDDERLLNLALGEHLPLRCAAYQAIALRGGAFAATDRLIAECHNQPPWFVYFALKALAACAPPERRVVCELLVNISIDAGGRGWVSKSMAVVCMRDFILARRAAGEQLRFSPEQLEVLKRHDDELDIRRLLERLGEDATEELRDSLGALGGEGEDRGRSRGGDEDDEGEERDGEEGEDAAASGDGSGSRRAAAGLASLGRVWAGVPTAPGRRLLEIPEQAGPVGRLERSLQGERPRSCLLVGEPGVGKRAIVEMLARRLIASRWRVLEAGHTDIIADQKYIGQFEGRLQKYVRLLSRPRRVWFVPDFGALRNTGAHEFRAAGALQLLLPHIESGELRVVGSLTPSAYGSLVQSVPWVRSAFDVIRVEPMGGAQALAFARAWLADEAAAEQAADGHAPPLPAPEDDRVLEEAWALAEQFLSDRAAPGNLLQLVSQTRRRVAHAGGRTFGRADLVTTLAELTGLPPVLLDDRQSFDVQAVRDFFAQRILGQDEAVDCLAERITMMKAGLTDPGRPQGVFLFVGPTGTGKTEIAKVLAEYLFGSPDRLIRLDMSEYKLLGSAMRLLRADGGQQSDGGRSLVSRVRQQPFSVILLDEFEKSASDVWDLFLQVADDGRLTDEMGETVDFRHTILILTSNLGATAPSQTAPGFARGADSFSPLAVRKAVDATFRREFLNRLDRIIVFRPFTRETMRELLQLEIRKAGRRRGLRHRDWAAIWDDSAVDFLLRRGFTPDLGARPLRRAVERYLLAPLAEIMAQGRTPEGDQFLIVHADGDRLVTEFVDPDAPEPAVGAGEPRGAESRAASSVETAESITPQSLVLDPRGGPQELEALRLCVAGLEERLASHAWRERKEAGRTVMARPDFWDAEERFAVLGAIENIDRVESGLKSAGDLFERLTGSRRDGGHGGTSRPERAAPRDLVGNLATRLHLLAAAVAALENGDPWEAYLLVDAGADTGQGDPEADCWAQRLAAMCERWAARRRMKRELLVESGGRAHEPWRQVSAVSGYAAYSLLAGESGLHVWEDPDPRREGAFRRHQVLVRVVPQPARPAATAAAIGREAVRLLGEPTPDRLRIVRYYRSEPSPLVRDRIRGWRCGRLERVLDGAFDVMGEPGAP